MSLDFLDSRLRFSVVNPTKCDAKLADQAEPGNDDGFLLEQTHTHSHGQGGHAEQEGGDGDADRGRDGAETETGQASAASRECGLNVV